MRGEEPLILFKMNKLILLFHTLKYLKWQQFLFRIRHKFVKPKVSEYLENACPTRSDNWCVVELYEEKITDELKATFLGHTKILNLPLDWNDESHSKLWTYNLHYFEDLLAFNAEHKREFHLNLLSRWIEENPVGYGNGWEPYPASLRIANILKAWLNGLPIRQNHIDSVYAQASYLSNDLEKHLLGNHYFVNLKALLFAGVIFNNERWLNIAEKGLLIEIPEQTLDDGANFELTPMYHSLLLVDMLDMYNLCGAYSDKVSKSLKQCIELYIPKMLRFMEVMSHPDKGVSFFNDSVDGIAPSKVAIESYAKKLGFPLTTIDLKLKQALIQSDSGYMVAVNNGAKVIFDAAEVGPDYIPGHAHADTLSFELSLGMQRVFVNSGTSEYGLGPLRMLQRKTLSHNTVEVNGRDSSQVWSGFRVAKRARIVSRGYTESSGAISLYASHNGYGNCIHKRQLTLGKDYLQIEDELQGNFEKAVGRLYLHPDLNVILDAKKLFIKGAGVSMYCAINDDIDVSLEESKWFPGFGQAIANKCLEVEFKNNKTMMKFFFETEQLK
ncbi:heparinase II/III family protein [Shewanella sp. yb_14]|uniref:heparinase II/III family protein n=1 Tax=Shewanella TaxID=22 RepID=UPI003709E3D7